MRNALLTLSLRALLGAVTLVAAGGASRQALAAEPCILVKLTAITLDTKITFPPGEDKITYVKRVMQPNLQRIRSRAADVFGERNLMVAFDCPRRTSLQIGRAEGEVIFANNAAGAARNRFVGRFHFEGEVWNDDLLNDWGLRFDIENRSCEASDELLAVSNALVDHRKNSSADIPQIIIQRLGAFLQRDCGTVGSDSYRELWDRLKLLGYNPPTSTRRGNRQPS